MLFGIRYLLFAIRYLLFAIRYLLFVVQCGAVDAIRFSTTYLDFVHCLAQPFTAGDMNLPGSFEALQGLSVCGRHLLHRHGEGPEGPTALR